VRRSYGFRALCERSPMLSCSPHFAGRYAVWCHPAGMHGLGDVALAGFETFLAGLSASARWAEVSPSQVEFWGVEA
jgi:hypothetical protein